MLFEHQFYSIIWNIHDENENVIKFVTKYGKGIWTITVLIYNYTMGETNVEKS